MATRCVCVRGRGGDGGALFSLCDSRGDRRQLAAANNKSRNDRRIAHFLCVCMLVMYMKTVHNRKMVIWKIRRKKKPEKLFCLMCPHLGPWCTILLINPRPKCLCMITWLT